MPPSTPMPGPRPPVARRIALISLAAAMAARAWPAMSQQSPASPGSETPGREERDAISALITEDLLHDPAAPVLGNPQGDVTMVEFFDYRCPYCKLMAPSLAALIGRDHGLRLVMKEYPVLSRESIVAAKVALVAARHGAYGAFHTAMFALKGPLDEATVMQVAQSVGVAPEMARAEMADPAILAELRRNLALGAVIGVRGTPAFVIGSSIVPGAVSIDDLAKLIAAERGRTNPSKETVQ